MFSGFTALVNQVGDISWQDVSSESLAWIRPEGNGIRTMAIVRNQPPEVMCPAALLNTSSSIASVKRPVNVFCCEGW